MASKVFHASRMDSQSPRVPYRSCLLPDASRSHLRYGHVGYRHQYSVRHSESLVQPCAVRTLVSIKPRYGRMCSSIFQPGQSWAWSSACETFSGKKDAHELCPTGAHGTQGRHDGMPVVWEFLFTRHPVPPSPALVALTRDNNVGTGFGSFARLEPSFGLHMT